MRQCLIFCLLTPISCLLSVAMAQEGDAGSKFWVGDVAAATLKEEGKKTLLILQISEDLGGGPAGNFDEGRNVILRQDPKEKRLDIVVDQVAPGKAADLKPAGLVKDLHPTSIKGSYIRPKFQVTAWGREIQSLCLQMYGQRPLKGSLLKAEKEGTSKVTLTFQIEESLETPGGPAGGDLPDRVEIGPEGVNAQRPPARAVGAALLEEERRKLAELEKMDPEAYVTVVYPARYNAPAALLDIISPRKSTLGSLTADADRAILVLTDRAGYVRSMLATLIAADRPIPQVRIEATITEISHRESDARGIRYSFLLDSSSKTGEGSFDPGAPDGEGGAEGFYRTFSGRRFRTIQAALDLLIQSNRANLLAQPTVVIANNREAQLTTGRKIPVARLSSREDTSTATAQREALNNSSLMRDQSVVDVRTDTSTVEFLDVGVTLKVTPRIFQADEALLEITPSFTEILDRAQVGRDLVPVLSSRSLKSTVRVRSGEAIGIGGLFEEKERLERHGVPLLKDIPVLGWLFSYRRKAKETGEIVFLLKVDILYPE